MQVQKLLTFYKLFVTHHVFLFCTVIMCMCYNIWTVDDNAASKIKIPTYLNVFVLIQHVLVCIGRGRCSKTKGLILFLQTLSNVE